MKITHDTLVSLLVWTSVIVVGLWTGHAAFRLACTGLAEGYRFLSR